MARLSRDFYNGDTVETAQNLLGMYLVRMLRGEALVCRITETEAYVGRCDKACHAYHGEKPPEPPPFSSHRDMRISILFTACTTA